MSNFIGQTGQMLSPRVMVEQQNQIGKPSEIERLLIDLFAATDRIEGQVEILLRRLDVVTIPSTRGGGKEAAVPEIPVATQLGERISIIVRRLSDASQRLVDQNDSLAL